MSVHITIMILVALAIVLHLAIAVLLVRKYLWTRDVGLLWLGVAVVIWPLVSGVLDAGERTIIYNISRHQTVGFYPFSLIVNGQITMGELSMALNLLQEVIGVCLLLVAVLYLSKTKNGSDIHATS